MTTASEERELRERREEAIGAMFWQTSPDGDQLMIECPRCGFKGSVSDEQTSGRRKLACPMPQCLYGVWLDPEMMERAVE